MKKNIFEKYINSMDNSCPDMDRLWEKISDNASAVCNSDGKASDNADISPFERAMRDCRPKGHFPTAVISAAAAAAVLIIGMSLRSVPVDITVNEAAESPRLSDAADSTEENAPHNLVVSVSSWNYSTNCDGADSYSVLSLAYTPDDPDTGLCLPEGAPEYFVEENVLADTDGFIDCRVISAREISDVTVRYLVEVVHFIGSEGETIERQANVISHSPYALRTGREYLLPIRQQGEDMEIAFDNAPQIEITADRQVVYHNGWDSLGGNGNPIEYPQTYPDDFYFDRMNLTAESSLDELFKRWRQITP